MTTQRARVPKALTQTNPLDDILLSPHRQCTAISKRSNERCKNLAMTAQRTCRMHGGATRRSKVAAAKRIADASGYAAELLVEFMADPKVDIRNRIAIAQDLLNRANVSGKTVVSVESAGLYERILGASILPSDEFDDLDGDSNVIDAEIVEDPDHERDLDAGIEARERERAKRMRRRRDPEPLPSEQRALDRARQPREQWVDAAPFGTEPPVGSDAWNRNKEAELLRRAEPPKRTRRRRVTG